MTEKQQETIRTLRGQGYGYTAIARTINSTKDKVVAFCRKHNLTGQKATSSSLEQQPFFCLQCNDLVVQTKGRKKKKFCCGECRVKWWNSHPENVNRKAIYTFQCACCGSEFTAYGNAKRKYCSHSCYIKKRYQGGVPDEY